MLKYVLVSSLIVCASAQAQDKIPTPDNWRDLNPEICAADPRDELSLRPVIFPPVYRTSMETLPDIDRTELIIIPEHKDKTGEFVGARILEKLMPDMRHPRTVRKLNHQYIGFLNDDDVLVNEQGLAIDINNPLQPANTHINLNNGLPNQWTIWERPHNKPDEQSRSAADLDNHIGICEYYVEPAQYDIRTRRVAIVENFSAFKCRETGYAMSAPLTYERNNTVSTKIQDRRLTFWDNEGVRRSGKLSDLLETFNQLSEQGVCKWRRAKLDRDSGNN